MLLWLTVRDVPPSKMSFAPFCRTMGLDVLVGRKVTCLVTPSVVPSTSLIGDGPNDVIVPLPVIMTELVSTLLSAGESATVAAHGNVTLGASPCAHCHGRIATLQPLRTRR